MVDGKLNDMRVGYYEVRYEDAVTEEIEILDILRVNEHQNIGYISNIEMELYPVCGNYFKINDKSLHAFDGRYKSPQDLKIYSLKIKPICQLTTFTIIYYYYL